MVGPATPTEPQARASEGLPPLSLYLHFPWCVRKCPYCDFNSHTLQGELPEASYLETLRRDLALQTGRAQGRALQSIFLGGGTPSLFSPKALGQLLQAVRSQHEVAAAAEITLEANPGTIERGRFEEYRAAGITRVSLGAQSFAAAQLERLGRIHSAEHTRSAVAELRACGLTNFNLDLMYALPQQTIEQAVADIDAAIALQPLHVSHYQLTLEPGTVFGGRPPAGLPDLDECAHMQYACQRRLAQAGYRQYEVSGYALEGAQCRHNLNYWRFGDYLGIGAGAHGKCSRIDSCGLAIERTLRPREPRRYGASVQANAGAETFVVAAVDLPFEYMMNALRLNDGFEQAEFESRTGLPFERLQAPIERARQRGLLENAGTQWRASPHGFNFLNDLVGEFLPRPLP